MNNWNNFDEGDNLLSVYSRDASPAYAVGRAPMESPPGTIWSPALNSFVDVDIAESMGLGMEAEADEQGVSFSVDFDEPDAAESAFNRYGVESDLLEPTAEEMEETEAELEDLQSRKEYPLPSETLQELAQHVPEAVFKETAEFIVNSDDAMDSLDKIAEATGLDHVTASSAIQTAVMEAGERVAHGTIGASRWDALVYAASSTEDPLARRIVTDVTTGKLPGRKLSAAYKLWWESLPDA
ncbi:hypothetical protein [Mesorhizobium sp. 1B3]|uniref:hypothetical protein n=1 Tax=Mesorhizobium sp. 1B3 TaxID=3243599 RepID=UPI003D99FCFA